MKDQALIEAIINSGMTNKEIAKRANLGYFHLVKLKNDKTIIPNRNTINAISDVLGPDARKALEDRAATKEKTARQLLDTIKELENSKIHLAAALGQLVQAINTPGRTKSSEAYKLARKMVTKGV